MDSVDIASKVAECQAKSADMKRAIDAGTAILKVVETKRQEKECPDFHETLVVGVVSSGNQEPIEALLNSIRDGSDYPFKVVIVDNGRMLDPRLASKYSFSVEILVPFHDLGEVGAWNWISRKCSGKSILFLQDNFHLMKNGLGDLMKCPGLWIYPLGLGEACFRISSELWRRVGEFDEGFLIGSYALKDIERRASIVGIPVMPYDLDVGFCDTTFSRTQEPSDELMMRMKRRFDQKWAEGPHPWNKGKQSDLDWTYMDVCANASDECRGVLGLLKRLSSECGSITQLGVGLQENTLAFLSSRPSSFLVYSETPISSPIYHYADGTRVEWERLDFLKFDIESTDVLVLDGGVTEISIGLSQNEKVNKHIVVFGTTTQAEGGNAMFGVVQSFLGMNNAWEIVDQNASGRGLIVLGRKVSETSICLHMIVKNEAANLERCLNSVKKWISCYHIVDTGSTDNTVELVGKYLEGVPGIIETLPFTTFGETRDKALKMCQVYLAATKGATHILLDDADMQLEVSDLNVFKGLKGRAYHLMQHSGALIYPNVRIVRADLAMTYRAVTHEFLDTGGSVCLLQGAKYLDYACGGNRPGKADRDAAVLLKGISDSSDLLPRYMFYLAQSYKDSGKNEEAVKWYDCRVGLGGWAEEVWYSRYMAALCVKSLGRESEFVVRMNEAAEFYPQRAESWTHLAEYYREKGQNRIAVVFAQRALLCKPSGSALFLEKECYYTRPMMALSVSGYYSGEADLKESAKKTTMTMTVQPDISGQFRDRVKMNVVYVLDTAAKAFPGSELVFPKFGVASGVYGENNPSLCLNPEGGYDMIVRSVNYKWADKGKFQLVHLDNTGAVITKNFFLRLDDDFNVISRTPLDLSRLPPPPFESRIQGYEDLRLFRWKGKLHALAMSTRHHQSGVCQQMLMELSDDGIALSARLLRYDGSNSHEKNWMPCVYGENLAVLYKIHPYQTFEVIPSGIVPAKTLQQDLLFEGWKGGSQIIPYRDGMVGVFHETVDYVDSPRVYWHRIVYFDKELVPRKFTDPFVFTKVGVEFCAGVAPCRDGIVLSFGMDDRKAGLCKIPEASLESKWVTIEKPWRPW